MSESTPNPADVEQRLEIIITGAKAGQLDSAALDDVIKDAATLGDDVHDILDRLDAAHGVLTGEVTGEIQIVRDRLFTLVPEAEGEADVGETLAEDRKKFGDPHGEHNGQWN